MFPSSHWALGAPNSPDICGPPAGVLMAGAQPPSIQPSIIFWDKNLAGGLRWGPEGCSLQREGSYTEHALPPFNCAAEEGSARPGPLPCPALPPGPEGQGQFSASSCPSQQLADVWSRHIRGTKENQCPIYPMTRTFHV